MSCCDKCTLVATISAVYQRDTMEHYGTDDKCTLVATISAVYQRDTMEHYGTDDTQVNPYEITPSAHEDQVLSTAGKYVDKNIIVKKIPYTVTSNKTGATVYIASELG